MRIIKFLKAFILCAVIAFGMAYMCVRELDKDARAACGMVPEKGRPSDCVSWWESNGITVPDEIKNAHKED